MRTRETLAWGVAVLAVTAMATYALRARVGDDAPADRAAPRAVPAESAVTVAPAPPGRPAVRGRVIDAATAAPIEDAIVVIVAPPRSATGAAPVAHPGDRPPSATTDPESTWLATRTASRGWFEVPLPEGVVAATLTIRARAAGYRTWRGAPLGPDRGAEEEIRLAALESPPTPGRVAGVALDADGQAFRGEIAVNGFDEFLERVHRAVEAQDDGRFVLECMAPGRWSLRLGDDGPWADVDVPDDGVVRAELRSRDRVPTVNSSPDMASVAASLDAEVRRLDAEIALARDELAKLPDTDPRRERVLGRIVDAERVRAARSVERARAGPHRALIVRGLPRDRRVWVSAPGDVGDWVVEARNDEAVFPPLALGAMRVEVRTTDAEPVRSVVRIVAGDGAQVVDLRLR